MEAIPAFFGTPSRRKRGKPRTPDGLPDSELDELPERRSSPRFAPRYMVQRRRWRQPHIQDTATEDEKRRANKHLENIDEVDGAIADGRAIALERIVDIIDQRFRQEAIKKALAARADCCEERKRKREQAAKTEAQHSAKAAAQEKLRARLGDVEPAPPSCSGRPALARHTTRSAGHGWDISAGGQGVVVHGHEHGHEQPPATWLQ